METIWTTRHLNVLNGIVPALRLRTGLLQGSTDPLGYLHYLHKIVNELVQKSWPCLSLEHAGYSHNFIVYPEDDLFTNCHNGCLNYEKAAFTRPILENLISCSGLQIEKQMCCNMAVVGIAAPTYSKHDGTTPSIHVFCTNILVKIMPFLRWTDSLSAEYHAP